MSKIMSENMTIVGVPGIISGAELREEHGKNVASVPSHDDTQGESLRVAAGLDDGMSNVMLDMKQALHASDTEWVGFRGRSWSGFQEQGTIFSLDDEGVGSAKMEDWHRHGAGDSESTSVDENDCSGSINGRVLTADILSSPPQQAAGSKPTFTEQGASSSSTTSGLHVKRAGDNTLKPLKKTNDITANMLLSQSDGDVQCVQVKYEDLVPFAAGGTHVTQAFHDMAEKFAELRVSGDADGVYDWDKMIGLLLEMNGLTFQGTTYPQMDNVLEMSFAVGHMTREEVDSCKMIFLKLKARHLYQSMDGDEWKSVMGSPHRTSSPATSLIHDWRSFQGSPNYNNSGTSLCTAWIGSPLNGSSQDLASCRPARLSPMSSERMEKVGSSSLFLPNSHGTTASWNNPTIGLLLELRGRLSGAAPGNRPSFDRLKARSLDLGSIPTLSKELDVSLCACDSLCEIKEENGASFGSTVDSKGSMVSGSGWPPPRHSSQSIPKAGSGENRVGSMLSMASSSATNASQYHQKLWKKHSVASGRASVFATSRGRSVSMDMLPDVWLIKNGKNQSKQKKVKDEGTSPQSSRSSTDSGSEGRTSWYHWLVRFDPLNRGTGTGTSAGSTKESTERGAWGGT